MVKDIIEIAVSKGSSVTITYSKDGEENKIIQLTDVSYSKKYGRDYITGFSDKKELTFKIDKILNVEVEWIEINNNSEIISINDGLYLIAFFYAWFLDYELKTIKKGERILEDNQDIRKGIGNCDYSPHQSLAYHYIPLYDSDESGKWITINKETEPPTEKGLYVVAYKLDKSNIRDRERKWIRNMWRCSNDIYYSFFVIKENHSLNYSDIFQNPHIEILAYHFCHEYKLRNSE